TLTSLSRVFFLLHRAHPRYPLFPYTTLFRSCAGLAGWSVSSYRGHREPVSDEDGSSTTMWRSTERILVSHAGALPRPGNVQRLRSEEHTSELQSQSNLVCRLLLEKKKKKNI